MTREIVFHLGDCKTGTTSIQRTLAAGVIDCPGMSLVYPARMNNIPLANALNRKSDFAYRDRRWGGVRRKIDASGADVAVISAEGFEFSDPRHVADAIETHLGPWRRKLRLIAYIRPHAERLVSTFAERTKQGLHLGPMEEMLDRLETTDLLQYAPRIARWKAVFGDAYEVRPMVRERLKGQDAVTDFVDWLVQGRPVTIGEIESVNESLTTADLAALRALYARLPRGEGLRDARRTLGWNLADLLSALPRPAGSEKPRLHAALAPRVIEAFRADAEEIDRLHFDGTPMTDALLAAPAKAIAEPQAIDAESYFDGTGLRFIQGTADMLGRILAADPPRMTLAMRPPELRPASWPEMPNRTVPGEGPGGPRGRKPKGKGGAGKRRPNQPDAPRAREADDGAIRRKGGNDRQGRPDAGPKAGAKAGPKAGRRMGPKAGRKAGPKAGRAGPKAGQRAARGAGATLRDGIVARLPWSVRHRLRSLKLRLFPGKGPGTSR